MGVVEEAFADFVAGARFEDLPAEVVSKVKQVVLNDLGALVGGAAAEGCPELLELASRWGGREEATVLVHGTRLPAHNAALVNGAMMRALDIDDHMPPGMHVGGSALPAALAAAELVGSSTGSREHGGGGSGPGAGGPPGDPNRPGSRCLPSGRDLLTALAVGFEMAIRINDQSHYDGFDPSGVCGLFAAVAAASRMMGLGREKTLQALGLGYTRPVQTFQALADRTLAVRVGQGLIAQAAVASAEMADAGLTGPSNFLEGVFGYFRFYGKEGYDSGKLLEGLGEVFHLDKVAFKTYPSCGQTIAGTDGMLELIHRYDLKPEEVKEIRVAVTPYTYNMTGKDFSPGTNPRVDAQFSIKYCLANALLRRGSLLRHFDLDQVTDPRVLELTRKIHITPDPSLEGESQGRSLRTDLEVITTSGERHFISVPIPSGFPGNPLSEERVVARFREAASYGDRPLFPTQADHVIDAVQRLEELADVGELVGLLASAPN